jgi:signal transduction histidine kinase
MAPGPTEHRTASCRAASVGAVRVDPRVLTLAAAGVGAAATVVVVLSPAVRLAYDAPSLDVLLETTGDMIALLAAYLVVGRFRQSARLNDLLVACGLVALAGSGLLLHIVLAATEFETGDFPTWAPVVGRLLGALLLAGAAFAPAARLRHPRRVALMLLGVAGLLLPAIGIIIPLVAEHLQAGVDPIVSAPDAPSGPQVSGPPVLLAGEILTTALFAAAAVGFTRRAARTHDELFCWLSMGYVLASVAALHFLLFPARDSQWICTDDLALLLAQVVVLVGAAREIRRYWEGLAAAAVLEERRRIARDFHDGLAQELAYILRRAQPARSAVGREIAAAAERALSDARGAIEAIARPVDQALDTALLETAKTLADRLGQRVVFHLQRNVRVEPPAREQLVRIAGEAITNAARHGHAPTVLLELSKGHSTRLRITDDGVGFDPEAIGRRGRFGLVGMRERARALDADFRLTSVPGRGTEIEVILR